MVISKRKLRILIENYLFEDESEEKEASSEEDGSDSSEKEVNDDFESVSFKLEIVGKVIDFSAEKSDKLKFTIKVDGDEKTNQFNVKDTSALVNARIKKAILDKDDDLKESLLLLMKEIQPENFKDKSNEEILKYLKDNTLRYYLPWFNNLKNKLKQ